MNKSDFIVIDFETGSRNPYTTQPIEVAMLAIHGRKLEVIEGSEFVSLMKPFDDDKAIELGLDPIQDEALEINHKTREQLANAPDPKLVWKRVTEHIGRYNVSKNKWNAPVMVGYNSDGFDYHIVHRLCCLDPYNYGPVDDSSLRNKLFHPINYVDVMKYVWAWTENNFDIHSISLDSVREWMGISKVGAHEALKDVRDTAAIFIKFMKLHRNYASKVKFANAFGGNNVLPNV